MLSAVLYSALAGVAGTGLGGIIGAAAGDRGNRIINYVLSLTGGIMVSIVCFELMPEAFEVVGESISHTGAVLIIAAAVVLGMALTAVLDLFSHRIGHEREQRLCADEKVNMRPALVGAGIMTALAVALHNFPEGMALGVITNETLPVMAVLLALHNIPAGMSMALPLIAGGVKKGTALIITSSVGAVTVLGAVTGSLIGGISEIFNITVMSVAAGALLYVSFCEILPHAFKNEEGHAAPFFALAGLVLGFVATFLLHG